VRKIITKKKTTEQLTSQQGFTLLELLMVITIVGIMVSVTVFSFGALDQRRLNSEASQLQLALNQASDAALMKQINLGWFFHEEENTYYFLQLNNEGEWIEPEKNLAEKTIFKPYTLNSNIKISVEVPSKPFGINNDQNSKESKFGIENRNSAELVSPQQAPYLLFLSSGEYTPFDIRFTDDVRRPIQLQGNGFGKIISGLVNS